MSDAKYEGIGRAFMQMIDANIERDRKLALIVTAEIKQKGGYDWAAHEIISLRRQLAAARGSE